MPFMPAFPAPFLPVSAAQEAAARLHLSSLGPVGHGTALGTLTTSYTNPGYLFWLAGPSAPVRRVLAGWRDLGLVVRRRAPGDYLVGSATNG